LLFKNLRLLKAWMFQSMLQAIKRAIHAAIRATGYTLTPLPRAVDLSAADRPLISIGSLTRATDPIEATDPAQASKHFAEVDALLARVKPWSGQVPSGYVADFLGILTDGKFLWNQTGPFGGRHVSTQLPTVAVHGEGWFEIADWFYSASEASGQYVAISLGASYGPQLVGAWKVLQAINPMPARLVAVEPVPQNCEWTRQHMAANGIDPDEHWIVQAALGVDNEPMLFPVGAPGTGLTASVQTNSAEARRGYADTYQRSEYGNHVLSNILLYNSTGITHELKFGYSAEVKFISAVTLRDVLAPFDRVDLLEMDIQEAEAYVIAPFMHLVNKKVRRVHIGTHGRAVHDAIRALFSGAGWEIVFDYGAESRHVIERGILDIGDGILSARNPKV
jgi:FkbM family methyltransferase